MSETPHLTDRAALARHRAKASEFFLHETAREEVQDRLDMVTRQLTKPAIVTPYPHLWEGFLPGARVVEDTPVLDLQPGAHDLVIHAMGLHWADDPIGQLVQCRRAMQPDGLMLAVSLGGQTLHELRAALGSAEAEITGGISPRVAPMAEIRDLGALLQRAGLALPVADSFPLRVHYDSALHLMRDLRAMGEGNALQARLRRPTRRSVLIRAAELYHEGFATDDAKVEATFEVITLTGWSPDESQPQPLRPGSATHRLSEALNTPETPLKD